MVMVHHYARVLWLSSTGNFSNFMEIDFSERVDSTGKNVACRTIFFLVALEEKKKLLKKAIVFSTPKILKLMMLPVILCLG